MGQLRLRNGIYYASYYDKDGIRRQPSLGTGDLRVARARLRDLELGTTSSAPPSTYTVAEELTYYLTVALAQKPATTRLAYTQKSRHLARVLGDQVLAALTREHMDRYIAQRLTEGAHTHSIHKELVVLRGAIKAAESRGHTVPPPTAVPPFKAGYEPRRTWLTFEQFTRLLPHLAAEPPPGAPPSAVAAANACRARRMFYCVMIAYAAPRRGELEAMGWEHVSVDRTRLQIPKGKTKSRRVAVSRDLAPWIQMFGDAAGWRGPMVAAWPNVGRDLPAACKRAGVPRCTPNDLRRTFASWLVQQRESLYVVARLLGHSSTRMVELVYGQLSEDVLDAAIDRLPSGGALPPALPGSGVIDVPGADQGWNRYETRRDQVPT